jgi:hypothetical protein
MKPETFGDGEPGTLAKGLDAGSGLSLGVTRDGGLGETLAESLARTLAETLCPTSDEVRLAVFSVCSLNDLEGKKGGGFGAGKSVGVPTPGRPTPWVLHHRHLLRHIGRHDSVSEEMKGVR